MEEDKDEGIVCPVNTDKRRRRARTGCGRQRARARLFKQGAIACVHLYRILGFMPLRWASARAIVRDVKEVKSRPLIS